MSGAEPSKSNKKTGEDGLENSTLNDLQHDNVIAPLKNQIPQLPDYSIGTRPSKVNTEEFDFFPFADAIVRTLGLSSNTEQDTNVNYKQRTIEVELKHSKSILLNPKTIFTASYSESLSNDIKTATLRVEVGNQKLSLTNLAPSQAIILLNGIIHATELLSSSHRGMIFKKHPTQHGHYSYLEIHKSQFTEDKASPLLHSRSEIRELEMNVTNPNFIQKEELEIGTMYGKLGQNPDRTIVSKRAVAYVIRSKQSSELSDLNNKNAVKIDFNAPSVGSKYPSSSYDCHVHFRNSHITANSANSKMLLQYIEAIQIGVTLAFKAGLDK